MKVFAIVVAAMAAVASAAPNSYPTASADGYNPSGQCTPATYACEGQWGWKVCNTSGQWEYAGQCPPETVCKFYPPSKSPYCVPPNFQIP